jgi:release factor glutamine methyltransferase
VARARATLAGAGIESAALDARLLVAHALGWSVADLIRAGDRLPTPAQARAIAAAVARRADREPLAYITGRREFWSLEFRVTPATLIPRPDSETLVETALRLAPSPAPAVLDLGTGSGCLLLALLHALPRAHGVGLDRSEAALRVARLNADGLGLAARAAFVCSDWADAIGGRFDLIVCNPPYVATSDHALLAPEITAYEPATALVAGADGLDAYRRLLPALPALLAPGGQALFEIGCGQRAAVEALVCAQELQLAAAVLDLGGICRVLVVQAISGGVKTSWKATGSRLLSEV